MVVVVVTVIFGVLVVGVWPIPLVHMSLYGCTYPPLASCLMSVALFRPLF
jgi:hypothetical protein